MFPANVLAVEDCPNGRSTCQECGKGILPAEARVRAEKRGYCHLACYRPRCPVTITPSDIINKLQRPHNQSSFTHWLSQWNAQFQPLSSSLLPRNSPPSTSSFSRLHIEVFKFLSHSDLCLTVELVAKEWRALAWSEELWRTLAERDYPEEQVNAGKTARDAYIHLYAETCLACNRVPRKGVRVICPITKRPICTLCYQKPGSSIFPMREYAALLGVNQEYIREAAVPVYSYNSNHWVFSHQADQRVTSYRSQRRLALLKRLESANHLFALEDLQKIMCLNLSRAKYIGVVLRHKFEGEEDLIDLLNFIYSSSESKGLSFETLLKRNRRRRLKSQREQQLSD